MQIEATVIPIEKLDEYKGVSRDGNPYVIGTWKVKGVLDGKEFAVKAFSDSDERLTASVGMSVDCTIELSGKPWKDKYFNDVSISNVKNKEGVQDVPSSLPESKTPMMEASSYGIKLGGNQETDLPF